MIRNYRKRLIKDMILSKNELQRYRENAIIDEIVFGLNKDPMLACSLVGLHETREILMTSSWIKKSEEL